MRGSGRRSALLGSLLGACVGYAAPGDDAHVDATPTADAPPATAPAPDPQRPDLGAVQAGLDDVHRDQTPILDRIEDQGRGRMRATRTYEDGTQYMLVVDPLSPKPSGPPAWSRFVVLTPQGVQRLEQVIRESVLPYDGAPPPAGPSGGSGTITWVVHVDGKERVVQTASGSYANLPAFVKQLDEAVSQNVQPVK